MTTAPVEVFAALGDPTRHQLLELLARQDRASAAALAQPLQVTRQAVEKHLRLLEHVGLVRSERAGRRVAYAIRTEPLQDSAAWLQQIAAAWDRRLAAVKVAAEAAARERLTEPGSQPGVV